MIVYHGTSRHAAAAIIREGPQLNRRAYVPGRRPCFCTTQSLAIARLFAIRRSPAEALVNAAELGVVLEFELTGPEDAFWQHARCGGVLQDEQEIVVFTPEALRYRRTLEIEERS